MSSHGAFVITEGRDENTSPDAMLSLTRTACQRDAFSVSSNSRLRVKGDQEVNAISYEAMYCACRSAYF